MRGNYLDFNDRRRNYFYDEENYKYQIIKEYEKAKKKEEFLDKVSFIHELICGIIGTGIGFLVVAALM